MKNTILSLIILLLGVVTTYAQTMVGIKTSNYPNNPSVLLEFSNNNKGLIVPSIASPSLASPVEGTIFFDSSSNYMMKYYNGTTNINLTGGAAHPTATQAPTPIGAEDATKQTIIGAKTTSAVGAVVLESTTKVMVLPLVTNPHLNIINPSSGMIVYDPTNHKLCTFNGAQWTFWSY